MASMYGQRDAGASLSFTSQGLTDDRFLRLWPHVRISLNVKFVS